MSTGQGIAAPASSVQINKSGWQRASLGKLLPIKYGKSLPAKLRDITGSHPVFGSSGIVGTHSAALTTGPTLIVGRKGNVGAIHYSTVPCWPIDTAYFVEAPAGHNLRYYKYLLESLNLVRLDRSTAIPGLSRDDYNAVVVSIAPPEQQDEIVAEIEKQFSRLDEAVANLKRVKANLKRYKASVLTDVFENANVEWIEEKLKTVCDVVSGFAFRSPDFCAEGVPAIKIANVGYGEFTWKDQEYLPSSFRSKHASFEVHPGDLLLALTRPITNGTLKVCRYPDDAPVALLNQRVAVIRPNGRINRDFLFLLMQSSLFKNQLQGALSQTLQPNLSPVDLKLFTVRIPPLVEQQRVLADIDRRLSLLRGVGAEVDANLQRAQNLKQAILAKSFTSGPCT